MITIADAVEHIYKEDFEAQSAERNGILDVALYSSKIREGVEKLVFKNVNIRTIAVTLKRLIKSDKGYYVTNPKLNNVFVHTNLVEFTFEKNRSNLEKINALSKFLSTQADKFFTITQSINELTIVCENVLSEKIKEIFTTSPIIFHTESLSGVTVKFSINYLKQPNIIFEITRRLANKKVNIIEIVSTATELTFVVNKSETEVVVSQMTKLL